MPLLRKPKKEDVKKTSYKPTEKELAILLQVRAAYDYGEDKLATNIKAFSNRTPQEIYEVSLNAYNMVRVEVEDSITNGWKANVKTATTRDKVVAIISSFIKQMMIPSVKAVENSVPKEQRARVMRSLLDYWRNKVKYDTRTRELLIDVVASPYSIIETGFEKVWKNKRVWNGETQEFDIEQVVDDTLTGFYMKRLKFGQLLVSNIEEREVQRQEWVIKRSINSMEHYMGLYKKTKNFIHVSAGSTFSPITLDIDEDDKVKGGLVEEVIYYSRTRDEYIVTLNGIIVEDKSLTRKRIKGDYPFARVGSEPLTEEYSWFSYPLILRLNESQKILDHLFNLFIDAEYMNTFRPKAVSQDLGADSFIPGTQTVVNTDFESHDLGGGGSGQIPTIINMFKNGVEEIAPAHMSGIKPEGEMSRRQWTDLSDNAFTSQGIALAEWKDFVEETTRLAINDILQHLALPAVNSIVGGTIPASVIIRNGYKGDTAKDMQIMFNNPLASDTNPLTRSFDIQRKEKSSGTKIMSVNPSVLFSTDFDVYIEPETLKGNKEQDDFQRAQIGYNVFSQSPVVNLDFVTKEFGKMIYKDKVSELMKTTEQLKQEQAQQAGMEQPKQIGGDQNQPKVEVGAPNV